MTHGPGEGPPQPRLVVVRGDPSDDEVAALVAVLAARAAPTPTATPAPDPPQPSLWRGGRDRLRRFPTPGPGAWRMSGLAGMRTRAGL